MKKTALTFLTIAIASCFIFTSAALAGPVLDRQIHQQKRIHRGIKSGKLTAGEVCKLEKEQKRIRAHKRKALSDGVLSCREKTFLKRDQDRASRHIYWMKHNNRRK